MPNELEEPVLTVWGCSDQQSGDWPSAVASKEYVLAAGIAMDPQSSDDPCPRAAGAAESSTIPATIVITPLPHASLVLIEGTTPFTKELAGVRFTNKMNRETEKFAFQEQEN